MPEMQQMEGCVYLEVFNGQLVERSKTPKPRFEEVQLYEKDKKTPKGVTYIRKIPGLEEYYLMSVKFDTKVLEDGTKLHSLKIRLKDSMPVEGGASSYQIQLRYGSVAFRNFVKILPNIQFGVPLNISIFPDKKTESSIPVILIKQQGKTVKFFYTKENPNGLPNATQDPITMYYDYKSQDVFLYKEMLKISQSLTEFWAANGIALPEHQAILNPRPVIVPQVTSPIVPADDFQPADDGDNLPF